MDARNEDRKIVANRAGSVPFFKPKGFPVLLMLRLIAFFATTSATVVMALKKETKTLAVATIGSSPVEATLNAKFQRTPYFAAFVFFVVANGMASLHNFWRSTRMATSLSLTSSMLSSPPSSRYGGSRSWIAGTTRRPPRFVASLSTPGKHDGSPSPAVANPLLLAAKYTVDNYIKSGMVVGLGSGNASFMAIRYLGEQLRSGALEDIVGVPTSVSSASEAAKAGVPLKEYEESSRIDVSFDDADIMENGTLSAVIGRHQLSSDESIIQEKSVLAAANNLVFVIPQSIYEGALDGSIPVLVQSLSWMETAEEIDDLFLGDAEVWRRPSIGHADPLGGSFPLLTKEGHNVLDVIFTSPIISLAQVAESIDKIDGVVDHGIIYKPCTAVIASDSGISVVDNMQQF